MSPARLSALARAYTPAERAGLQRVFGGSLDYDRVLIRRGPGRNPIAAVALASRAAAIAMGSTIYLAPALYREDYADDLALLAHETTHIWQYQNTLPGGVFGPPLIACQSLAKGGTWATYDISRVHAGTPFGTLGFEQQATVVQAYYDALRRGDEARLQTCARVLRSARPGLMDGARESLEGV